MNPLPACHNQLNSNDLRTMLDTDTTQNATQRAPKTPTDSTPAASPAAAVAGVPGALPACGTPSVGTPSIGTPPATRRGGAPAGNANRLTHGLDSHRLILGSLTRRRRGSDTPEQTAERRSLAKVEQQALAFRATLEQAVVETHGSISLTHACLVATASRWERHAMLALRWLREQHAELTAAERLTYSREIATASANRDKAIERLRLDKEQSDWYGDYLAGRTATPAAITHVSAPTSTQEATPAENACNSVLEHQNSNTPTEAQQ